MKNRNIQFHPTARLLIPLALACFAVSPAAQAVLPPPDGGYPGFNTAEGTNALKNLTTGSANTAVGWRSLFSNTDGSFNTGVGGGALVLNNGSSNTAVGTVALLLNITGTNNTAVGTDTLVFNDSGSENTAVGTFALENNTVDGNTATGAFALVANTAGGNLELLADWNLGPNTAVGSHALESNVDGSANTAVGYNALHSQVHGDARQGFPQLAANTAVGFEALANVTGSAFGDNYNNTALGYQALFDLTDGAGNLAVGGLAGKRLTTGNGNIFIGNIHPSSPDESFHTYIGNIRSTSVSGGGTDYVTINLTTGLLGHLTSSRRYKEDINPMDKASEALHRLKPVTYRYKKEIDKTQSLAFGLIAEEVAEVNPDLVAHDAQGRPESVHYEMVNAMLLNEFLKEHRTVQALTSTVAKQEAIIAKQQKDFQATAAHQQKQIEALTAGLQKISAQLEASKPAPQVVNNP